MATSGGDILRYGTVSPDFDLHGRTALSCGESHFASIPCSVSVRCRASSEQRLEGPSHWRSSGLVSGGQGLPRRLVLDSRAQDLRCAIEGYAVVCHDGPSSSGQDRLLRNGGKTDEIWIKLFSFPTEWWDNRLGKVNPTFPDFKHKRTHESLWLESECTPRWVETKLATTLPGTFDSSIFSWNQRLVQYAKTGQYEKTMKLFKEMQRDGINLDRFTFSPVLNACAGLRILEDGRRIHMLIMQNGFESDLYVGSSLVNMYAKCGSIEDAETVFKKMPKRNVVTWNTMILGYGKCGEGQQALELYQQMQQEGVDPDQFTFVAVLNACASIAALEEGRFAHEQIIQKGYQYNTCVSNCLVDMYAKCGSIEDAWKAFSMMPTRNVVAWTAIIMGYVKCGQGQQALELYGQMQLEAVDPDPMTFVAVLNACASIAALEEGRRAHEQITQRGYDSNVFVGSSLIDMYAKCGRIEDAWKVFCKMPKRNVVAWNAMILGYVKCGDGQQALELSRRMKSDGVDPDRVNFMAVLNACASIGALEEGKLAHDQVIQRGYESDVLVSNSLVDMYAKCGSIEDAWKVFSKLPARDVVGWNAMIMGYVKCREGGKALELYHQMQQDGVDPDPVTYVAVLNACAGIAALEAGRHAHERIIQRGYESDIFVSNCLVDMYAKCGSIQDARSVFSRMSGQNVVAWNAMILGYVRSGQGSRALELYHQMQKEGMDPDPVTYATILNACSRCVALEEGRKVHGQILQRGYESDVFLSNCLIDMYTKCGCLEDAQRVFGKMPTRDVVAWTAMILGYVKCGEGQQALELFRQMQKEGVDPDPVTYQATLNACASIVALEAGRGFHHEIIQKGFESNVFMGSTLIDMYAKCGSIEDAQRVFSKMPTKDVVAWTAMLTGYGRHGYAKEAIEHFARMCRNVEVNGVTFVSLLSACSHGGLVDEGLSYFESMSTVYDISPTVEHYSCVVDLLGRAGHLHEAEDLINTMPFEPNATVWITLLSSCRSYGNVEMGEHCTQQFLELEPHNPVGRVLLSNIYAAAG